MENIRTKKFTKTLEKTVEKDCRYLEETQDEFRDKSQMIASVSKPPLGVIGYLRVMYREMKVRLAELSAIRMLLKGKYRRYARRDRRQDKKISELEQNVKVLIGKFERSLKIIREKAEGKDPAAPVDANPPAPWFRGKENQLTLVKNIRVLDELDYAPPAAGNERRSVSSPASGYEERRITLFVLQGDPVTLDTLQFRLKLRQYDIIERYGIDEIRGMLTHLRGDEDAYVDELFHLILARERCAGLKCVFINMRDQADIEKYSPIEIEQKLSIMAVGEIQMID